MGRISDGAEVARKVQVFNPTKEPVKILSVVTDCGCTVAEADTKEIPPGSIITMEVDFRAPITIQSLDFKKHVALKTSAGSAALPVTGVVRPRIEADSADLDTGKFEDRQPARSITFTNNTGQPVTPSLLSAPVGLQVAFSPESGGKFKADFTVSDTAMLAGDWADAKLQIALDSPFISKISLPVNGSRARSIRFEPKRANFGFADDNTRPITVKPLPSDGSHRTITLRSLASKPNAFQVEILPEGAKISPVLTSLKPGTSVREEIVFQTDDPAQPLAAILALSANPKIETECCGKTTTLYK